jgi:EAL domain-containing protein (putative c-di-GMP-specific phosphodiesterase class I)
MVEELENILENESLQELTAEDTIQLALEIVTNSSVDNPITKKPLVAEINREHVQFVIDDTFQVPLYGGELLMGDDDAD